MVVLTHVAEAHHFMPWMGWGRPDSPGHYLDLASAIGGLAFIAAGIVKRVLFERGRRQRSLHPNSELTHAPKKARQP